MTNDIPFEKLQELMKDAILDILKRPSEAIAIAKKDDLETQIVISLKDQGIDRVGNDACTVSIKQEIVPTVRNWDAVHEHVLATGQFELMQKRMSATAYRELIQMGHEVPGVEATELTRMNFRSK
jgi:hypothetical protein